MKAYIYIGLILTACNPSPKSSESIKDQASEIRKMMEEDSFTIDTQSRIKPDLMDERSIIALNKIALKPLRPSYDLSILNVDNLLDVYNNLLKTIDRYKDSDDLKQAHLMLIFENLEAQNKKLELENDYPIELKLKVASIKSDIHFLRSNRQLKTE